MIDISGGCMPLYSSKGLYQNNLETRRNNNNIQKIPYQFQEIASKTLIYQEYSTTIARTKHPRDSVILPSNKQVIIIHNSTRERDIDLPK
jgi:hypothetical protein